MTDYTYRTIVVALDVFSEYEQVLNKALALDPDKSKYHLIHVTIPQTFFEPYAIEAGNDFTLEIQEKAEAKLKDIAQEHEFGPSQIHSRIGNAADEIHELAASLHADLIILGTHGRSGLKLLLGSTATAVLHGAKCDVLSIKI
ncbi:universal stress protein [Aestuariibacter sp. AA17]|uniref:Universal stress protein n=1 Tax=Fluctibacter corallii TaxID=2984329 RepID=A0ABT3A756_9ALTE|nr:universal stress protein [Aestuariibacter sp. AA17]MCV2884161.1 universal stress protein [Aestuariibacter sp. AA17]